MNINNIMQNVKNNFKNILGTTVTSKVDNRNNMSNSSIGNGNINNNINSAIHNGINRVSNTINNVIPNKKKYNNYGNMQGNFKNGMNNMNNMYNMYNSNLKYNIITEESLRGFLKGDIVILDVRIREEYMAVHLKNSINLPLEELTDNIQSIVPDKTKNILVYCFTGDRTKEAILKLNVMGYTNIYIWGNGGLNTLNSKEFLEY